MTNNVVSSNFIQKRKYSKGYFINPSSEKIKVNKPQIKNNEEESNSPNKRINNKAISVVKNVCYKENESDNSSDFLASIDDVVITKKEKKNFQSNRPILSDCKNIMGGQKDNVKRDSYTIQLKYTNPFPKDKPDDKPKVNGMAVAGFISILLSVLILTLGTTGGTFFLPMGIICLVGAAILSIIGYKGIKKGQSKGKWLAIAGLALEILVAAFILFYFLILPQIQLIG
ncbi:MAG: ECF transporter S component [Bacteroidales bacterium]|jgi:hypothetical protein